MSRIARIAFENDAIENLAPSCTDYEFELEPTWGGFRLDIQLGATDYQQTFSLTWVGAMFDIFDWPRQVQSHLRNDIWMITNLIPLGPSIKNSARVDPSNLKGWFLKLLFWHSTIQMCESLSAMVGHLRERSPNMSINVATMLVQFRKNLRFLGEIHLIWTLRSNRGGWGWGSFG